MFDGGFPLLLRRLRNPAAVGRWAVYPMRIPLFILLKYVTNTCQLVHDSFHPQHQLGMKHGIF